jgi:hypothetical protein
MNPNVINIFSNDDLIKSIEIDHEVKNNNTNSFDELLHKVDNEKVFSEDNLLNASHDKTEDENKTSNNSNKNELNENQESSVHNDTKDGNVKEVAPKNKEASTKDLLSNDLGDSKDKSEVVSAAKNVKQSIKSDKIGNSETHSLTAVSGNTIKNKSKSNISVDRQRVVNKLTEQLSNDQVKSKTLSNLDINSNQSSVKNESINNQNANARQVGNILNNKIIGKNPNNVISNNMVSDAKPSKIKNLTQSIKKHKSKVSSQNNFNLNKENSQIDGSLNKKIKSYKRYCF